MRRLILFLFTLSGMCALVYELVWARWLGLVLGNFATASALVISTFMVGLALGNAVIGKVACGRPPGSALRAYGALEAGVTGLAGLSPLVFSSSGPVYPLLAEISSAPTVRPLVCAALLLPPTFLMGGTLPAMVQALSATSPGALGPLYSLNTLGGALGPLLAAFLLIPALGLRDTLWIACLLNAAVAAGALVLAARRSFTPEFRDTPSVACANYGDLNPPAWIPGLFAALSGFVALGFEIGLTRLAVLTITGSSVYGLAIILSTFLSGLALGAWFVRRHPPRHASAALGAFALAQALVWLFSLSTPFWDRLPPLMVRVWWSSLPFGALTAMNFALLFLLLLALTAASGFALPALAGALPLGSSAAVGRLFAANTLGAVLGALVTGFLLLRFLGLNLTLLALGTLALLTAGAAAAIAHPRDSRTLLLTVPLLATLPVALPSPDPSVLNAGMYNRPDIFKPGDEHPGLTSADIARHLGTIVYQRDGLTARVAVRQSPGGDLVCVVNGKVDGSTNRADMFTQVLMAHIPALAHPHPRAALVIGLGTGVTAGSLAQHPSIEVIDVVEIEPLQAEVARIFDRHNHGVVDHPKVVLHFEDARRFLLTEGQRYDLIVSEPSNLWVSGMVNLFTREFYESSRERLNAGGIFFQWIHYYRVSGEDLRSLLRTFRDVFPEATLWAHGYGDAFILGRNGRSAIGVSAWNERAARPEIAGDLKRLGLEPSDLFGFFLWGPGDLERYAGSGPLCTDDAPNLEFSTARLRYSEREVKGLRREMQSFGPLDPVPLAHETADQRLRMAVLFLKEGSMARARAEYRRALDLDPQSREARRGLAETDTPPPAAPAQVNPAAIPPGPSSMDRLPEPRGTSGNEPAP